MLTYNYVKQAEARRVCSVSNGSVDTTLVGSANLNPAYRIANLGDNTIDLQQFTNTIELTGNLTADGATGTFEIWGYPDKGPAQFFGVYTVTSDEAVDDEGRFFIDAFVQSTVAQHTAAVIKNMSDGIATMDFDSRGIKHLVVLATVVSAGRLDIFSRSY